MGNTNEMEVIFDSRSANESFARVAVAAFLTQLNPTMEEVSDVKQQYRKQLRIVLYMDMKMK